MKKRIGLILVFLLFGLLPACSSPQNFDSRSNQIAAPYRFDALNWEISAFMTGLGQTISGTYRAPPDSAAVLEYFAGIRQVGGLKHDLTGIISGQKAGDPETIAAEIQLLDQKTITGAAKVEATLERQIRETLTAQGISGPLGFPPVGFKLNKPVHLMVISSRDHIGAIKEVLLNPDLTTADMEDIEAQTDQLGVSSLVVELGGTAVLYPTFVSNRGSLHFTIDAAVEEWAHQYLAFKPLGSRYLLHLLGIDHDPDIVAMNETVAGMVSREIGNLVYKQYYQQSDTNPSLDRPDPVFNRQMREIRLQVDKYLAAGQADRAEQYMNEQRQKLASEGFYIRKLNQAYFAFYGNYTTSAGSVTPVGGEFRKLRAQSPSLSDFLNKASSLTNHQQLIDLLK